MAKGLDRRTFYLTCIYGMSALITGALAATAGVYLFTPPRPNRREDWIPVGDITRLPMKEPEEIVYHINRIDGWKVTDEKQSAWLVKMGENDVVAYSPQCTHLGCAYHWEEKTHEFLCPCHTSTFSIDGRVLTGPAPRSLDRFEVKVDGTKVLLGRLQIAEQA